MLKNLFKTIFPDLCIGCNGLLIKNESVLCIHCRHDLPYTQHHKNPNNEALLKFYGIVPIENCFAMLYFHNEGIAKRLMHQLKYKGKQEIGTLLGNMYYPELEDKFKHEDSKTTFEIIPVPLHKKRQKERGYNQVTTFCKALSKGLDITLNETLLIRNHYTKTQTQKNKIARQKINDALFDIVETTSESNKHYILVDDIITTGATLEACAKALLRIPNAKVSIVTMAFTET
ncbi:ComF family protein [Flavobacterium chuncheonense]|uniref:ComF family protein n=1 Tax=Flavobacterium chuncheonense TaxID=2026653 RepID=A0ABW5YNW3_9FLAO